MYMSVCGRQYLMSSTEVLVSLFQVVDATPAGVQQGQQLLQEMEALEGFRRKMMAHSILYKMHHFLVDSKLVVNKRERSRGRGAVTFYTPRLQ